MGLHSRAAALSLVLAAMGGRPAHAAPVLIGTERYCTPHPVQRRCDNPDLRHLHTCVESIEKPLLWGLPESTVRVVRVWVPEGRYSRVLCSAVNVAAGMWLLHPQTPEIGVRQGVPPERKAGSDTLDVWIQIHDSTHHRPECGCPEFQTENGECVGRSSAAEGKIWLDLERNAYQCSAGWLQDAAARADVEMPLVTVLAHEIGHILGCKDFTKAQRKTCPQLGQSLMFYGVWGLPRGPGAGIGPRVPHPTEMNEFDNCQIAALYGKGGQHTLTLTAVHNGSQVLAGLRLVNGDVLDHRLHVAVDGEPRLEVCPCEFEKGLGTVRLRNSLEAVGGEVVEVRLGVEQAPCLRFRLPVEGRGKGSCSIPN